MSCRGRVQIRGSTAVRDQAAAERIQIKKRFIPICGSAASGIKYETASRSLEADRACSHGLLRSAAPLAQKVGMVSGLWATVCGDSVMVVP